MTRSITSVGTIIPYKGKHPPVVVAYVHHCGVECAKPCPEAIVQCLMHMVGGEPWDVLIFTMPVYDGVAKLPMAKAVKR